ncbi:hypothetical protein BH20ACI1_BH20ACI1_19130 [soil metagenome]
MKSVVKIVSGLGCLLFILLAANFVFAQKTSAKTYVEGELLIKYKNGTASAAAFEMNSQIGSNVVEEFPEIGWQRVKIPANLSFDKALSLYKSNSEVEYVQPNFYYHLLATPNDAQFGTLYGMQKISALSAWDLTTGSSAVVVADIATGLKYTHEDLAANAWRNPGEIPNNRIDDDGNGFVDDYYGYDFFYNDSDPIDDAGGHGTHTAGTIGAVGNNGLGVVGVNWNVKIMAIKIYSPNGSDSTSAMLVNAYNYIRMMKNRGVNIRITNNSYGGCGEACGYDQATKDALDAMGDAGILNVFAAGNNGRDIEAAPFYPASYTSPSLLAVAASDSNDNKAGFSNFGTTSVDVAAPGVNILSTWNGSNSDYNTISGTSMATPHTAGAAALLSAYNPNLSPASLKATLMNTVDVLPQWNGVVKTGGRINVARALQNQTVCTFTPADTSQTAAAGGGTYSVNIVAPTNCDYSIKSNDSWITITSGITGSSNGTVSYTVQPSSVGRTGTINVGGTTFTVYQLGPTSVPMSKTILDFDGDGHTDYSAIQNNNGAMVWHNYRSTSGYLPISFGSFADDIPVANDFDGDGKTDIAVWRNSNGTFYVLRSQDNTFTGVQFGQAGDAPNVSQDFDGDGKADFAVTRAQNGTLVWYILRSRDGFVGYQFGTDTDKPLRGDYDGDRKADLAVYRPNSGSPANTFFIQKSSDGNLIANAFGTSVTDKIVPGDYDGDGKTDIAVWRTTNGVWYYLKSSDGNFQGFQFGADGDLPTPGDYDGDGRTDFAVYRPNVAQNEAGIFYVQKSTAGFSAFGWGNSSMKIPANSIQSR